MGEIQSKKSDFIRSLSDVIRIKDVEVALTQTNESCKNSPAPQPSPPWGEGVFYFLLTKPGLRINI